MHASLDWCVKNAFSESDTDNVGRCILHATNIPCQTSVQVHFIFSRWNVSFALQTDIEMCFKFQGLSLLTRRTVAPFNLDTELQSLAKQSTMDKIITMYPVLEPTAVYSLHAYFSKVKFPTVTIIFSPLYFEDTIFIRRLACNFLLLSLFFYR